MANKDSKDSIERMNRFAAGIGQPQEITPEELERVLGGAEIVESDNVTQSYLIYGTTYTTTVKAKD